MKYQALDSQNQKHFFIPVRDGGVDLSKNAEDISESSLKNCLNIFNEKGRLKTRPGLFTDSESVIRNGLFDDVFNHSYRLCDTEVFIDGAYGRILTDEIYADDSNCFVNVYLIGDGAASDMGYMHFSRVDDSTFFVPKSITFYTGEKRNGGGIFALITLTNSEDFSQVIYDIYEINSEFDGWERNTDYYIPTVYINGRGNSYELAKQAGINFSSAPTGLEALNLLDSTFYAYYSSDGYSSSFRLPFSQLCDESVICRVYKNSETYDEWIISEGSGSVISEFEGKKVEMRVDREKGIISFYSSGENYAIPRMYAYSENNIRILAKKDTPDSFGKVVSCTLCAVFNSKRLFAGGDDGNKIYYTSYYNPLYFPQTNTNGVGSPEAEITAAVPLGNKVIAFKKSEIYAIEIKEGKALNSTSLLADNPSIFYAEDACDVKCISRNYGCAERSTIADSAGGLIWLADNRRVYRLYNNKVFELSESINPYLDILSREEGIIPAAAAFGDNYILCFGSRAVIMQYGQSFFNGRTSDVAWYIWRLPEESGVIGAFSYEEKPRFICLDLLETVCFCASLCGDSDRFIVKSDDILQVKSRPIKSLIETKAYYHENFAKGAVITEIYIDIKPEGEAVITAKCGERFCEFNINADRFCRNGDIFKLKTNICWDGAFGLTIKSDAPFSAGKAEVCYIETNN